jgi:hypothetical protein
MTPYSQLLAHSMRVEHRHSDGSWGGLEPSPAHDAAESDPERGWPASRIYPCTTGREQVRISMSEQHEPGRAR